MCNVNIKAIEEGNQRYIELILREFMIKKQALSTIKYFLNKCYILLNSQLIKLISGFLTNAITFFIAQDKKELARMF